VDEEDPSQLAVELGVILVGTSVVSVLHSDDGEIERARAAVSRRVGGRVVEKVVSL